MGTALVIENDPTDYLRRRGEWLTEAGLELTVLRPHAGDALPETLDDYLALVVLGGDQNAYSAADGTPGAPWFPALEGLLRKAVRNRVPTLAVCLGAQLLAQAHGGLVERSTSGPEIGPGLVGKRDAADTDPLFKWVPLLPDVEEVWQPFAARFASLALGTLPDADIPHPGTGRTLPLLGQ